MLLHCELMNVLLIPGFLSHILPPGQAGVRMRWRVHMCVRALSVRHSISNESSIRLNIKGSRRGMQEGDTWGPGMFFVVMRVVTMSRCCVVVMMRQNPAVACS